MSNTELSSMTSLLSERVNRWKAIIAIVQQHPEWSEQEPRLGALMAEEQDSQDKA